MEETIAHFSIVAARSGTKYDTGRNDGRDPRTLHRLLAGASCACLQAGVICSQALGLILSVGEAGTARWAASWAMASRGSARSKMRARRRPRPTLCAGLHANFELLGADPLYSNLGTALLELTVTSAEHPPPYFHVHLDIDVEHVPHQPRWSGELHMVSGQ